mgnify:CR=1 FL=1
MAELVEFELVTPARLLLSEQVELVVIPGGEGDFGVLPGHAPLISTVRPGSVRIYDKDYKVTRSLFVSGGFAEVGAGRCTLLAEEAVEVSDIDRPQAEERLNAARERAAAAEADSDEGRQAAGELRTAEAMMAAIE